MEEKILVTYSIRHLSSSEKVKLHYTLRGRNGGKGLLEKLSADKLGDTVLMIPKDKAAQLTMLFNNLNIPHKSQEVLIKDA